MKKLFILVATLITCTCLVGCGSSDGGKSIWTVEGLKDAVSGEKDNTDKDSISVENNTPTMVVKQPAENVTPTSTPNPEPTLTNTPVPTSTPTSTPTPTPTEVQKPEIEVTETPEKPNNKSDLYSYYAARLGKDSNKVGEAIDVDAMSKADREALIQRLMSVNIDELAGLPYKSYSSITFRTEDWSNRLSLDSYIIKHGDCSRQQLTYATHFGEEYKYENEDIYTVYGDGVKAVYSMKESGEDDDKAVWEKNVVKISGKDAGIAALDFADMVDNFNIFNDEYNGYNVYIVYGDMIEEHAENMFIDIVETECNEYSGSIYWIFDINEKLIGISVELSGQNTKFNDMEFKDADINMLCEIDNIDAVLIPDYVLREVGDINEEAPSCVNSATSGYWERTGKIYWEQENGDITIVVYPQDNWYFDNSWGYWTELMVVDESVSEFEPIYEVEYEQADEFKITEATADKIKEKLTPYDKEYNDNNAMTIELNGRLCYAYADKSSEYWVRYYVLQDIGGEHFLFIEITVNESMTEKEMLDSMLETIGKFALMI